ncbi:MAG TPA: fumarylacetoacetase [Burkholderiales bacterium]
MAELDATHDAGLKCWVESAHDPATDFPIQNLPFGVFRRKGTKEKPRGAVAIGDQVFDLAALGIETGPTLNAIAAAGPSTWRRLRKQISRALSVKGYHKRHKKYLLPAKRAELFVPVAIGDYTDFYAGIHHATSIGKLLRPDNPLLPNYKWIPIAYHGRASSVVVSGTPVTRPMGQVKAAGSDSPVVAPSARLDYEVELGFVVGPGNRLGTPIAIDEAEDHLFGVVLLNDWSARDLQAWEYQPLGPFLAKSFATTISPWIVTFEALAPFRCAAFARPAGDPQPLPYLSSLEDQEAGGLDIGLEMRLSSEAMRKAKAAPMRLSRGNAREAYWTAAQMVVHHSSNGCNLQPGDLFGSGTLSGAAPEDAGSLMELTRAGSAPLSLPGGETRAFLHDGDEVILRGRCEAANVAPVGFGECTGLVRPSRSLTKRQH